MRDDVETVPVINQNNNSNVVSNSNSKSNIKKADEILFDDIDKEVKATLKTTISAKVVSAIKNASSI